MPTYRFPIVLWQDHAGAYTAIVVDEESLSGFGTTPGNAIEDLRDYLTWRYETYPWTPEPDFLDPELKVFKVHVRPEYQTQKRIYPCEEAIPLKVHCVYGKQKSGQLLASLPLLGIRFIFHELDGLAPLVHRYVQQTLEGATPAKLARYLQPAKVDLSDVVVRIPKTRNVVEQTKAPHVLVQVAEPLGERAVRKQFSRAWERDEEIAILVRKLHREKANVLLVGEPGVGKTTVLVDAVNLIEKELIEEDKENPSSDLIPRRFWSTSAGRIIAGMKYLGQWEERCEEMISALSDIQGILCVDRLLDLVQTGGLEASDSVAAFFIPYLQRNELRFVAEATPAELDACRRLLPGLVEVFQIVRIQPFDRAKSLSVLDRLVAANKPNLRIEVAHGVTDRVVQLYRRFAPYQVFPGKAVGFLRELLEKSARQRKTEVNPNDVVTHFMNRTGLPELFLRDEIRLNRDEVLQSFREQVIDQEEGCQVATNLVMTFKAGLNDPNRPIGGLLFCGPTGVGKTEMAQSIARYFFGHSQSEPDLSSPQKKAKSIHLIRLDMSEYASFDAVDRLVGPPNGQPSEMIRKIRQQPFCVLLLDEIEKASPDVFDVLLGVFDEGRLSDRYGRVTNFRSAIIIMTSNLGADKQSAYGFDHTGERSRPRYRDEAMAFFRPEFFNRLDGVVTFNPLSAETIRRITRKELNALSKREGLERLGTKIIWSDALVDHLSKVGFDARYGARPLQRTIEREVVAPLAKYLLTHSMRVDETLIIDRDANGNIQFR